MKTVMIAAKVYQDPQEQHYLLCLVKLSHAHTVMETIHQFTATLLLM